MKKMLKQKENVTTKDSYNVCFFYRIKVTTKNFPLGRWIDDLSNLQQTLPMTN